MNNSLKQFLDTSFTSYHAVNNVINLLKQNSFTELKENEIWTLEKNKGYYICRDSSSLIAFVTNDLSKDNYGFNMVASHTDSPCLKIKNNSKMTVENYSKCNIEVYGGALQYTWFDKPLKVAGRVIVRDKKTGIIKSMLIDSKQNFVIPSLAIHMNRGVNDGFSVNPQTDLCPLMGIDYDKDVVAEVIRQNVDENFETLDYDLYFTNGTPNFYAGINSELLCSPRIDNLTSVYSSIESLIKSKNKKISMAVLFDNEEVGSSTKQGAGGKFLISTLERINYSLGYSSIDLQIALANSFIVSNDNAHALHPNHADLNDPTNKVLMGKGVVIKHHANQNYTTDAFSASIFKQILKSANVKYQDFFMKSNMRCGSTLGAISSSQVSVRSVDIGLAELAMHSNMETMCIKDYEQMVNGLIAFYESQINFVDYDKVTL